MNDAPTRPRRRYALLLLLATVAPLLPTLRAAYVYDDTTIIRDNVLLHGWGALARVWTQPYWPSDGVDALGLYRPLQLALLSTVWNATGGSPHWMHAYALVLAAITTFAVWRMLRQGAGAVAAIVAAVWFATLPLHVEPVASVANTSELVVVLCTVGIVWMLGRRAATPDDAMHDWARAAAIGLLAAAALFAKESGLLAVPLAALTTMAWRLPSQNRIALRAFTTTNVRAWSAALVCVIAAILARLTVLGAPVSHGSIAAQGLGDFSTGDRVTAMMSLWPRIAQMIVWPTALAPYYGPTSFPSSRIVFAVLGLVILLALVVAAFVVARRGDTRLIVTVGWMALSYFPASNLATPTGQILSDRALFGMTVGAAFALAWGIDQLNAAARRIAIAACVIMIARDAWMSAQYAVAWTSHRTLWARLAEVAPDEHLSAKLLGMDARGRGDTTVALAILGRAFAQAPQDRQIRFEYGQVLYSTGRYSAAVTTLAPLLKDTDVRSESGFLTLYLDAVGRAGGPQAVVTAAAPLLHSESGATAALFLGVAHEQLGSNIAADSAYSAGLRRSPGDSILLARRTALRSRRSSRAD